MRMFESPSILWMPDVFIPSKMDNVTVGLINVSKRCDWRRRNCALDKERYIEVYIHEYLVQQHVAPTDPVIITMYDTSIEYSIDAPVVVHLFARILSRNVRCSHLGQAAAMAGHLRSIKILVNATISRE